MKPIDTFGGLAFECEDAGEKSHMVFISLDGGPMNCAQGQATPEEARRIAMALLRVSQKVEAAQKKTKKRRHK